RCLTTMTATTSPCHRQIGTLPGRTPIAAVPACSDHLDLLVQRAARVRFHRTAALRVPSCPLWVGSGVARLASGVHARACASRAWAFRSLASKPSADCGKYCQDSARLIDVKLNNACSRSRALGTTGSCCFASGTAKVEKPGWPEDRAVKSLRW